MNDDELYEKFVSAAISFVSYRQRSTAEIRQYLQKMLKRMHTVHSTLIDRVIARLDELHYIDDQSFAESFLSSRLRSRPKSRQTLIYELLRKGIPEDVTRKILEKNTEHITDLELARNAIERKIVQWKRLPKKEMHMKLYGFLLRRGFHHETIRSLIDEIDQKDYNT